MLGWRHGRRHERGCSDVTTKHSIKFGRVYEARTRGDGNRVLVDRIWPRGVSKAAADLDEWCAQADPSTALQTWYGRDPELFDEFARRYRAELEQGEAAEALAHLRTLAKHRNLTLLTASKAVDISQAAVLAELVRA